MGDMKRFYGSSEMREMLGYLKTELTSLLSGKVNSSDLGTAASRNATNQITEGSTALSEAGAVKSYVDNNVPSISNKADKVTNATSGHLAGLDSNGNLTDSGVSPTEEMTVEGNPVTFDSPFEQDAKSVVVSVKPIQDLHGYDHPWPAGGGKNKLPLVLADIKANNTSGTWSGNAYTLNGVTFTVLTDSNDNVTGVKVNGTASAWASLTFGQITLPAESYKISSASNLMTGLYLSIADVVDLTGAISSKDFTVSEEVTKYCYIGVSTTVSLSDYVFTPMVCLSSATNPTTFAPYSNICPISGIDEVEIGVSGKNLFDNSAVTLDRSINTDDGTVYYTANYDLSDYIRVGGSSLVISGDNNGKSVAFGFFDADKRWFASASGYVNSPISIPNGAYYVRFDVHKNRGNIQCELGSTATPYEPYNPNSHTTTIPLPSTLYDGDVDVTEGDADSKNGLILASAFTWLKHTRAVGNFYCTVNSFNDIKTPVDGYTPLDGYVTNMYETSSWETLFADPSLNGSGVSSNGRICIQDSNISTLEEFNAIANTIQICYPRATPTTVSFDPTDVELLEGTNVVTTNAEKVAVTYKAGILATLGDIDDVNDKVKTKFDKANVATIETGSTTSKTYYKGDYIVRSDGCLYDVTATIASGAAFTNSNTHKTNIGNELNKFKVYVSTDNSPVDGNDVASVSIPGYLPISPFQVFSWSGSGTVSITPKSSGGTWNVSGDVSDVRYGQMFMRM